MTVQLSNQLKLSSSAYLRQHADQPVHWQIWSKETLELAKQLNRPILLSIGYAACHWCHVMAHESFDDEMIAHYMNEHFINIKIDREERPDLDQIYMAALTAMGEQGGWPLTMFLTPDAEPFWGGTYFPPHSRYNRPGFDDVLRGINQLYHQDKEKVNHNSRVITEHIRQRLAQNINIQSHEHNALELHQTYTQRLSSMLDLHYGGIKGAPKFPSAPLMEILWLQHLNHKDQSAYDAFHLSLRNMLQGGIYDHLGGGLCRYSVDDHWLVPHFEKMLYDNSQLIKHSSFAYAYSQKKLLRIRIEETIEWLQRELELPQGGFASSLDADSEGVEGKYYVWQNEEIDELLGYDSTAFCAAYNVTSHGNWEGCNILNRLHSSVETPDEEFLLRCKERLFEARQQRIPPARDDKLLVDWNGQLIVALVNAGRVFDRPDWIELGRNTYAAIMGSLNNQPLAHSLADYVATVPALSSDYAAMINAAVALYGYYGDEHYMLDARRLIVELNDNHCDENGDYRLTALTQDDVIIHIHADQDDATPSATAQLIEALARLALVDQDYELQQHVEALSQRALTRIQSLTYGQAGILNAALISQSAMILHIFTDSVDHPMIKITNQMIDMRRTDIIKIIDNDEMRETNIPHIGLQNINHPSAYLCIGNQCLLPVYSNDDLEKLLKENAPLQI
ncbi:thioredoxin domain-containing protein [Paenochrobactrum pullorum]|uniref:thioredoxin domain-containing protein n=1 Tax=Paenochrobactrum pullorum TaxID=1324351 RepID=UPI0035BC2D36